MNSGRQLVENSRKKKDLAVEALLCDASHPGTQKSMTDSEALTVQKCVDEYLQSAAGRTLDLGNPRHLEALVRHVQPRTPAIAADDLWVTVAMCWLGPPTAGIPPAPMRTAVLELLRQLIPEEHERVERGMEFAIAYGCGKWREVQPGSGGWEHRWQGAVRGLVRALEPAVGQSNRWLAEHVAGFPQDRGVPHDPHFIEDTAMWSDAWMLANKFVRPEDRVQLEEDETLTIVCTAEGTECVAADQDYEQLIPPGAKGVWTVHAREAEILVVDRQPLSVAAGATVALIARDEDVLIKAAVGEQSQQTHLKVGEEAEVQGPLTLGVWECTCGTTHCEQRHRLESWDPIQKVQKTVTDAGARKKEETALTLWNFVASAVKGPHTQLQTGSFVQGLYFPLLSQEGCES